MNKAQELAIKEIQRSIQNDMGKLNEKHSQTILAMYSFNKQLSLLKSKKSKEDNKSDTLIDEEDYLRAERQETMKQYADCFQINNEIKKEMTKVNDLIYNSRLNQIDNVFSIFSNDSSSEKSTSDRSFSDDLNEICENEDVSNEFIIQYNDSIKPDNMSEPGVSTINKNNSNGNNNNLISENSQSDNLFPSNIFKCSVHKDKDAKY